MMSDSQSLHVVLFLPSIETGGVERNAIIVANHLVQKGVLVTIVYTRSVDVVMQRFDNRVNFYPIGKGVRIPYVHPRISDAIVIFFGFIRFLHQLPFKRSTVILSFQSNIIAIIASIFNAIPVIARVSNHPSHVIYEVGRIQRYAERLKRIFYRYATVVVTNSEVTSKHFRQILSIPVETIYNPIDTSRLIEIAREQVEHPWLVAKRYPVVIAVGRLSKQKNFPLLINAFAFVLDQIDARLILVGEGEQRGELESLVEDLGLAEKVDFLGYQSNVYKFVSRSDLFVLSSNFEGMPNVLVEAIAAGVPVVSTNCLSGPSEILNDGRCGDLVPIGDKEKMAAAIVKNLTDLEYARNKHNIAYGQLSRFDYSRVMKLYESLLQRVANIDG